MILSTNNFSARGALQRRIGLGPRSASGGQKIGPAETPRKTKDPRFHGPKANLNMIRNSGLVPYYDYSKPSKTAKANLYKGVDDLGWGLDYKRFRAWLAEKYGVKAAYIFIGLIPKYKALYKYLQESGFKNECPKRKSPRWGRNPTRVFFMVMLL